MYVWVVCSCIWWLLSGLFLCSGRGWVTVDCGLPGTCQHPRAAIILRGRLNAFWCLFTEIIAQRACLLWGGGDKMACLGLPQGETDISRSGCRNSPPPPPTHTQKQQVFTLVTIPSLLTYSTHSYYTVLLCSALVSYDSFKLSVLGSIWMEP